MFQKVGINLRVRDAEVKYCTYSCTITRTTENNLNICEHINT